MAAKACEAWLRSSNHEKWAEAMVICESAAAQCGADGYCHYGGLCFGELQYELNRQSEQLAEFGDMINRFESALKQYPVLRNLSVAD